MSARASFEQRKLRLAYDAARDAINITRREPDPTVEYRLIREMSVLVMEVVDCITTDTKVSKNFFDQVALCASSKSQLPLLKLGFSLNILLEKLMNDRFLSSCSGLYTKKQAESSIETEVPEEQAHSLVIDPQDIKQEEEDIFEPASTSFTTDPQAIKVEQLDEVDIKIENVAEIKMEDPIVDVFCPTTGSSHPIGHMDYHPNEVYDEDMTEEMESSSEEKVYRVGSKTLPTGAIKKRGRPMKILGRESWKKCYLCGQVTCKFSTMPANVQKRSWYLSKIITNTPEEKARITVLRASGEQAFFCTSHIAVATILSSEPKYPACDLCSDTSCRIISAPKNWTSYRRLLANMIELTYAQKDTVNWFLNHPEKRAQLCAKHFKNPVLP